MILLGILLGDPSSDLYLKILQSGFKILRSPVVFIYLSESLSPKLVYQRNKFHNSHVNLRDFRDRYFEPAKYI